MPSFFYWQQIANAQMHEVVTMPSPNVASLGVFGNTPVSYYTGTPEINIPLHTVKNKSIELPVSLSYFSTGVMPDRHPGWVGVNWHLHAGGVITRKVNDLPDENYNYTYWENSQNNNITSAGYYYNHSVCNTNEWESYDYVKSLIRDRNKDMRDTEPDEFVFNFSGYSGSFYMDENGKWKVKSSYNITVQFDNDFLALPENHMYSGNYPRNDKCFAGFTLITDKGVKYVFGKVNEAVEYAVDYQPTSYDDWIATSWHLTKIIAPEGPTVNFEYEKDDRVFEIYRRFYDWYKLEYSSGQYSCETKFRFSAGVFGYFSTLIYPSYLTKIITPFEEVIFSRSTTSELRFPMGNLVEDDAEFDFSIPAYKFWILSVYPNATAPIKGRDVTDKIQWKKLDKITVISKVKGTRTLWWYDLNYNNSTSDRLMLQSVKKVAPDGTNSLYQFDYYDHPSVQLPAYASSKIDHWGYYNAKESNTEPGTTLTEDLCRNYWNERAPSSDINVLQEGSLKKISYPTGGFSEFIYEAHSYSKEVDADRSKLIINASDKYSGGLRIKKIIDGAGHTFSQNIVRDFLYVNDYQNGGALSSGVLNGQSKYFIEHYYPNGNGTLHQKTFYSTNILPFSNNNFGVHVGYSEVIEKRSDGAYIIYKYSNFDNGHKDELVNAYTDLPSRSFTPYDPFNDKSLERGHLLAIEQYKNNGKPVSIEINRYAAQSNDFVRGINSGSIPSCSGIGAYVTGFPYRIYCYNYSLSEKDYYIYDENGQNPILTKTNLYYENASHRLPTKSITINSNGESSQIEFRYPHDFAGTHTYDIMIDRNIISPIIEQKNYKNGTLLTQQKTEYALWYGNLFAAPALMKKAFGNNSLETEITFNAYDDQANIVQHTGRNNTITAYLWDYNKQFPIAKITNANAADVAYTSFEAEGTGNWNMTGVMEGKGFTGNACHLLDYSSISRSGLNTAAEYIVSYWSTGGMYNVTGTTGNVVKGKTVKINNDYWTYYRHSVTGVGTTTISGTGTIDELRLYPKNAQMITFTYDPAVGITSQCDVRDVVVRYEYDAFGRLGAIIDQDNNIIKKYCYNYAGQPEDCLKVYGNDFMSQEFTKNTCGPDYVGETKEYAIQSGVYVSLKSKEDANQQALNEINNNGQNYVNQHGACTKIVYARLEYVWSSDVIVEEEPRERQLTEARATLNIRFYSDEACTQPTSVSGLSLRVNFDPNTWTYTDGSESVEFECNGTWAEVLQNVPTHRIDDWWNPEIQWWQTLATTYLHHSIQPSPYIRIK